LTGGCFLCERSDFVNGFKDIIGHEQVIGYLQTALKNHKVSNAYMICGEPGSGKTLVASAFAKALVCQAGYGDACNMCDSCHQFDSGSHPDVKVVQHEKTASIGVNDVREQVINDVFEKPYYDGYKVYVIPEADKLTVEAQNALLKTIEEPPAYAVILLLVSSPGTILPTIRSRCIVLNLRSVDTEKIEKLLEQRYRIPDYQAKVCAAYAQGLTGKAVRMATSQNFMENLEFILDILRRIDHMEDYELCSSVRAITNNGIDVNDLLDIMKVWYRDVLVLKATNDVNQLVFKNEYQYLQEKANIASYESINNILKALDTAELRLDANVNFEIAMEMLLLAIKEN
jgi:DNA polymerase-3 subunit delta'